MSTIVPNDDDEYDNKSRSGLDPPTSAKVIIHQWEPEELSVAQFSGLCHVYSTGVMSQDYDLLMHDAPSVMNEVNPHLNEITLWTQELELFSVEVASLRKHLENWNEERCCAGPECANCLEKREAMKKRLVEAKRQLHLLVVKPPLCLKKFAEDTWVHGDLNTAGCSSDEASKNRQKEYGNTKV